MDAIRTYQQERDGRTYTVKVYPPTKATPSKARGRGRVRLTNGGVDLSMIARGRKVA